MTTRPYIYVGIDGSWQESGAVAWAQRESALRHEPICAVHVVEDALPAGQYFKATGDQPAKKLVEDVQRHLTAHDPEAKHEVEVRSGHPASALTHAAEDARMLVVGRRGLGSFGRLLIGSTSEAVAHQAQLPVVVVPDNWTAAREDAPVIVGVDDSVECEAAVEFAVTAAAERGAPVRLVHVWDIPTAYMWEGMDATGQYDEWGVKAERMTESLAEQWRQKYPDVEIQTEVFRAHPVAGLLEAAESGQAQLLVLGGRAHRKLTGMLLGSVARGVLHHATCPVAVVHKASAA